MPDHAVLPGSHQATGSKLGDISNILAGNRFRFLRSTVLGAIAPVIVLTLAAVIGIGSWQRADLFSVQGQSATTNVPNNLLSEGETSSETQTQPTALATTSTAVAPTPEPSSVTEDAAMAATSVLATDVAITPVISVPTPTSALPEPTPTFPSTGEGILIVPTITGGGAATPMVMTLYFPDPASATIVPAQYEIREPDGVTIANVLKGLLAGPPANLAPTLAPGTQVLSVAFDGGTLSIDLDRPIPGILERRALELTLAQFPGITSVRLLVNGSMI
jgi:spore germination protein GerM